MGIQNNLWLVYGWPTGPPIEERESVVLARITTEETNLLNLETLVKKFWEIVDKEDNHQCLTCPKRTREVKKY